MNVVNTYRTEMPLNRNRSPVYKNNLTVSNATETLFIFIILRVTYSVKLYRTSYPKFAYFNYLINN